MNSELITLAVLNRGIARSFRRRSYFFFAAFFGAAFFLAFFLDLGLALPLFTMGAIAYFPFIENNWIRSSGCFTAPLQNQSELLAVYISFCSGCQ